MTSITKLRKYLRTHCLKAVLPIAVMALAGPQPALAQQATPGKNDAVYMYRGADRDQRLVAKAREEGTLSFYTSMAPTESQPLAQAFEKKYGIKVELWRAANEKLLQRVLTEAQSKRHSFDVIETNGTETEKLARENLLSPFYTPHAADFPAVAIPAHRLWMPDRFNFLVVAFNTNKVKREELPKTYEGFADPKWKGRIALESGDFDWMATVIHKMGIEKGTAYFQKLSDMKPELRKGHPLLAELISAGEVPVGLTTFLSNAKSGQRRGGPIDWVPVQPVLGLPFGIAVSKNAPHPHAALLFADFILSPEGQELLNVMGRLPAGRKVKNNVINFPYVMLDVAASLDESEKREKTWNDLFLKK